MEFQRLIFILLITLICGNIYSQEDNVYLIADLAQDSIGIDNVHPRFPGCEELKISNKEIQVCAQKNMYLYIFTRLQYPMKARTRGTQGNVVVSFIIEKDGTLSDIQPIREVPNGCTEEVLRVINTMNAEGVRWQSGMKEGNPVRVKYILPVRFKMEGNSKMPAKKKKKKLKG